MSPVTAFGVSVCGSALGPIWLQNEQRNHEVRFSLLLSLSFPFAPNVNYIGYYVLYKLYEAEVVANMSGVWKACAFVTLHRRSV